MRNLSILTVILGVAIISFLPIAHAQLQLGEKIPDFSADTIEGKKISLGDYSEKEGKKVLILYFFAIWCEPCKEDFKYLQQIQDQYGTRGLGLLAILTPDSFRRDRLKELMQKIRVTFPILFDDLGVIARRCGVFDLPTSLVIKNGILMVSYSAYSEMAKRDLEIRLRDLLSDKE